MYNPQLIRTVNKVFKHSSSRKYKILCILFYEKLQNTDL